MIQCFLILTYFALSFTVIKMSSSCKNSPDKFCFICGEITLCSEKRNVTPKLRDAYFKYFGITLKQDEWWQPKYVCGVCTWICTNAWTLQTRKCRSVDQWSAPSPIIRIIVIFAQQMRLGPDTDEGSNEEGKFSTRMWNRWKNLFRTMILIVIHLRNHSPKF